jgi:agmatinase
MAMTRFDPNAKAAADSGIFGLDFSLTDAELVLVPVGFEATTSYRTGTAQGPRTILEASHQVDLYHPLFSRAWERGLMMPAEETRIQSLNQQARQWVEIDRANETQKHLEQVNTASAQLNHWVYEQTHNLLQQNKIVGIVGGDHSVPFGAIQASFQKHPRMSILHIDAHFDLRKAYEGYTDSHASIMYNVATRLPINSLVQVGLRDFCEEEFEFSKTNPKLRAFTDKDLFERKAQGEIWARVSQEIVSKLSDEVYVSLDIDGLDPTYCPGTGTPVPGGLSYAELIYLLREVVRSKKRLVGFDLVEVGSGEYDGIVGARVLYELSCLALATKA